MASDHLVDFIHRVPTPAFVVDAAALRRNLEILQSVQTASGATILLALKGFAMYHFAPLIRQYLSGVCASGPHEAQLGREAFNGEVHTFAPAFKEADLDTVLALTDHLVLNSFQQWHRFRAKITAHSRAISVGLRVNPQVSTGHTPLYDPCAPNSRLGILSSEFEGQSLDGIDGLHFHTLCEQNSDDLEKTLHGFEERFGQWIPHMQWVNFGGGHHITRSDYDRERLIRLIKEFRAKYNVRVYLEPGEAVALNCGWLVTEVLDILQRDPPIAILDTSVTAHMPDVLEMPYRPNIVGADLPGVLPHTYQLGGMTCLAGDVIGNWSFPNPLAPGDRIAFTDMAHYTMVKTTTFNGIQLPAIVAYDPEKSEVLVVKQFTYEDYRSRLS